MRKRNIIASFVLLLIIIFLPVVDALGSSAALRRQIAEIEQRRAAARANVQESQNLLAGLETEIGDLMDVMQYYAERMQRTLEDKDEIQYAMLHVELRLYYTEVELEQARIDRDAQDYLFRARVRGMHEMGPIGYLDVLLRSSSFIDMLIGFEHMQSIARADREILANRQAAEERFESTVADLEGLHRSLVNLEVQYDETIAMLEQIAEEQRVTLTALAEDADTAAQFVALYEATLRSVNAEMDHYMGLYQAALEEERRIQLELQRQERDRLAREAEAQRVAINANFTGQFIWPVPTHHRISSYFGNRPRVFGSGTEFHCGVDVPAPAGTRINAAADGYVRLAGWHGGFGLTVIIDHGNGYSTLYAHNSRNRVTVGQRVTQGQHIADVGTTGQSTGNHLHFSIRRNNAPINPRNYFPWISR